MGERRRSRRVGSVVLQSERRWQNARVRRRMTLRGRLTLAGLALLLGGALLAAVGSGASPDGAAEAEPAAAAAAAAVREAPRAILERLPVGEDALDLPAAPGGDRSSALAAGDPDAQGRLFEIVPALGGEDGPPGPLWVQYSLDAELTRHVFRTLRRGRVERGHVVLLDPATGRVLAYASTDPQGFPPTRAYPAASLVKVVTAAAALERDPEGARAPCRYAGNPYRLPRSAMTEPSRGRTVSLRHALATSNNRCFARLALHTVGRDNLLLELARFGWLEPPAPGHAPGAVDPGDSDWDVGRLGSGLAGTRITPLHAAQLAASLVRGERVAPRWIDRVLDGEGRELALPASPPRTSVLPAALAEELRTMLVDTTLRGTARSAFLSRSGRPRLGSVRVAGKTGSLTGWDPDGRYEWFAGAAPADDPKIAVAVLLVQSDLWWRTASQIAADVLDGVFCEGRSCRAELAERWLRPPGLLAGLRPEPRSAKHALN